MGEAGLLIDDMEEPPPPAALLREVWPFPEATTIPASSCSAPGPNHPLAGDGKGEPIGLRFAGDRHQSLPKNTSAAGAAASKHRVRRTIAAFLAVLSGLFVALGVTSVWVHKVTYQTDEWVSTVGPLATTPASRPRSPRGHRMK